MDISKKIRKNKTFVDIYGTVNIDRMIKKKKKKSINLYISNCLHITN